MRVLLCGLPPILTNSLDYRLRKFGMKTLRSRDANEAINRVHAKHADALVLSVNVQGFKLPNLIGLIREDLRSNVPIILVTDPEGDIDDVMAGIEAGADDFVTYPFKPSELVLRLKLLFHRVPHY